MSKVKVEDAKIPPHPFINPEHGLNNTALVIDALLAQVEEYLNRLCGGGSDKDFDSSMKHGCLWSVEASRQLARYVADAIDTDNLKRLHGVEDGKE